jgi:hypothetical protein
MSDITAKDLQDSAQSPGAIEMKQLLKSIMMPLKKVANVGPGGQSDTLV